MASFDWKKKTEDSIKDGLIITVGAAGIFFGLKTTNIKPPKTSLDAMDLLKLNWGNMRRCAGERLCSLQKMNQ